MTGSGSWVLIPDLVLFEAIAAFGVWEVLSASRILSQLKGSSASYGLIDDPETQSSSPGAEMRRWIQVVLILSAFSRGLSMLGDVFAYDPSATYRTLPDLLFLTMYSLLALFWAQLTFTAAGVSSRMLRPVFLVGLGMLYVAYIALCGSLLAAPPGEAWDSLVAALFYLLGVSYLSVLLFLSYFGVHICISARRKRGIFFRALALSCVCSLAVAARAVFYLAYASAWLEWDHTFGTSRQRFGFDAWNFALVELLPALLIMVLTTRGWSAHQAQRSADSATPLSRLRQHSFQQAVNMSSGSFSQVAVNGQYVFSGSSSMNL